LVRERVRIAIIGAAGQLGSDLCRVLAGGDIHPLTRADFDVCDAERRAEVLDRIAPEVVINTSAYHRVDEAEGRPDLAFAVNAVAVEGLGRWCAGRDATLVHFSTDYVFRGDVASPRRESDVAEPISVYGTSKLAGELLARLAAPRHFVIRTCGLYGRGGSAGKGGANFVELMLRLAAAGRAIKVVRDQVMTPTYTVDLAAAVVALLETRRYGLYQITNAGECSWYEFARGVFEVAGVEADLSPTTAREYGARAARPGYSVMANEALAAAGVAALPPWREALGRYFAAR
jgi:dTDP-4-dehydrorhamnose reductase